MDLPAPHPVDSFAAEIILLPLRALRDSLGEPALLACLERFNQNLDQLLAQVTDDPARRGELLDAMLAVSHMTGPLLQTAARGAPL